jgi:hypothetical protein
VLGTSALFVHSRLRWVRICGAAQRERRGTRR